MTDDQYNELIRLRNEARKSADRETRGCGDWAWPAGIANGIEQAADLMGRPLPPWKPEEKK